MTAGSPERAQAAGPCRRARYNHLIMATTARRRWFPRFSLRTLLLAVLLCGSGAKKRK